MAFKTAKRAEDILTWDLKDYNLRPLSKLKMSDLRAEYSRLRTIANKRLAGLKRAGFAEEDAYKYNVGKYVKLKEIDKRVNPRRDLELLLRDVARFFNSDQSTITGQRRRIAQTVETLQHKGLWFIDKDNLKDFGDFMEYMRNRLADQLYDSERLVDIFMEAMENGVDPMEIAKTFNDWIDVVKHSTGEKNKRGRTSKEAIKRYQKDAATAIRNVRNGTLQHGIVPKVLTYDAARTVNQRREFRKEARRRTSKK